MPLDDGLTAAERMALAGLACAIAALRIAYVFHYRIDSDEPQHLHVVWGWLHGLMQYRDVSDNHAPLFHLLLAPVLGLVGERADVVAQMRLSMLPLYALAVACTYAIAAALFSRRIAMWAALLTALQSRFFFTSLEFRADDLWAALWLLGVAVLVRGEATPRRCLGVGLLLGAAVGVSLKSVLLLASLAIAAPLAVHLVSRREATPFPWRPLAARTGALLAGATVVPAVLIAFFARRGALGAMYYGTVAHNVLPRLGLWHSAPARPLLIPLVAPVLWLAAERIGRAAPSAPIARRRILVLLTAGVFLMLLFGAWPLVTREDFLPVNPLVVLLAVGICLTSPLGAVGRWHRVRSILPIAAVAVEGLVLVLIAPPWRDNTRGHASLVAAVLSLTAPNDYVMDLKGEAVFRQRPFFYVLERITRDRLERNLIPDDVAARLVATRTPVVTLDHSNFPPAGRNFMNANYLRVGPLRVLGRFLPFAGAPVRFDIVIPASYGVVGESGAVDGMLDGTPYDGPRRLEAGAHEFVPSPASTAADQSARVPSELALVWAPALEHGFSPFEKGTR